MAGGIPGPGHICGTAYRPVTRRCYWSSLGKEGVGNKAMSEHRRAERESTYKAARIGTGSRAALHCGVKNLSTTGACLRVDDPRDVPETFNLVFDSGESSRMCRMMWRNTRQVGVRFE